MKNIRPDYDSEIQAIADYTLNYKISSELAYQTAFYSFIDAIACALMALKFPACTRHLGPIVPGAELTNGARAIANTWQLDPVTAAFNNGAMIRWLDFNDTWLAAEWGHPSDNLGAILAVCDYANRTQGKQFSMHDVLTAMIKAHEIQGIIALENAFNRVGLDHVVLVKVASTAVATQLLGGNYDQLCAAISQAWLDGQSLRTYRHAPNTGPRKSWAAGDATARAVRLALMSIGGEMGYPSALTAKTWGFYDVYKMPAFKFSRSYGSYVMENVLFKISFPAEFHAQTAVEAAITLHSAIKSKLKQIDYIKVRTQEAGMRIINKQGPLHNPADRDHCLQYMIAIGLIYGELTAAHYEDSIASNPLIDELREKMQVVEDPDFSKDYLDPDKRAIANAVQVFFTDGTHTDDVMVTYPIGHKRRRQAGIPLLIAKFQQAVDEHYPTSHADTVKRLLQDFDTCHPIAVDKILDSLQTK